MGAKMKDWDKESDGDDAEDTWKESRTFKVS